jgi:ribonuclease BN (tRNA processing enzyme)
VQRFLERALGRDGLYPELAGALERGTGSYRLTAMDVPATGSRRWSKFGSETVALAAIPVHHGTTPAIAWRVQTRGLSVTFAGDFDNEGNLMQSFARDTDALVVSHAVGEGARGALADAYASPTQIARIAAESRARMVILGHRMQRTRGVESQTEATIRRRYTNALIFANDLECWGL